MQFKFRKVFLVKVQYCCIVTFRKLCICVTRCPTVSSYHNEIQWIINLVLLSFRETRCDAYSREYESLSVCPLSCCKMYSYYKYPVKQAKKIIKE